MRDSTRTDGTRYLAFGVKRQSSSSSPASRCMSGNPTADGKDIPSLLCCEPRASVPSAARTGNGRRTLVQRASDTPIEAIAWGLA